MGLRNWLQRHDEQVDTSWTETPMANEGFERWMAQQGTNFLPPDTSGWPVAGMSPQLSDAVQNQWYASSYSLLYRSQPAVYTVVEFLAWQISQLNLKVYRRAADDDREHLPDSELERLFHDPAPGLTYSRLMRDTMADMGVYGNAYWALMETPQGTKMIVPLLAQYVNPRGGGLLEANTYQYSGGIEPQYFKAEQICHFRRYNPDDRRIGVSPLEVLRGITTEEAEMTRYRRVLWQKDARMAGFIRRPLEANPMDDDSRKRFRTGITKFAKGGTNEGSWMLLEEGEQPFPIAFSPKDAEYIEGRKLALETVARAYNIPLAVLSLTETATYASQKEFHQALYRDTLPPWTRNIEDEVQAKVLPWVLGTTTNTDIYVEFNLAEKLQGAFEEAATMLLQASGGPYMTRAEARARLNLPKLDEEQVDELVVTNNMTGVVGEEPPPPPAAQAGPPTLQLAPSQEEGTVP